MADENMLVFDLVDHSTGDATFRRFGVRDVTEDEMLTGMAGGGGSFIDMIAMLSKRHGPVLQGGSSRAGRLTWALTSEGMDDTEGFVASVLDHVRGKLQWSLQEME